MNEPVRLLATEIVGELRALELEALRMVQNPEMQVWYRFEDRTYRRQLLTRMRELGLIADFAVDTGVVRMP
jgi:hypothetical protein